MDEVYYYIFTNIYNKTSSIKFIKMDVEDLLFNKSEDYIITKLNKYFKQFKISCKNKIYKISVPYIHSYREFDILIHNNYWIVTIYPNEY